MALGKMDKWAGTLEARLIMFAIVGVIAYFIIKNLQGPAKEAASIGAAAAAIVPAF